MKIKIAEDPQSGEQRIVTKFAWLPEKIDATTMVWLEKYYQVQKYKAYEHVDLSGYWYNTPIKSMYNKELLKERMDKEIA